MTTQRTGTNPVRIDEADALTLLHLRRMGRELRLTDQILSVDVDSVVIVDHGPVAMTSPDGSVITINAKRMPPVFRRSGIAAWLGTNAHELFHNLYTPREGSPLMLRINTAERVSHTGIFRAWNILEDQRIERLGLTRYAAWRGYLIAALVHHVPANHEQSWTLLAGRTWLPAEVRAIARATFVAAFDEGTTQLVAKLIGDYQRLSDPGYDDADEAWSIVEQFWNIVGSTAPSPCGTSPIREGQPEVGDDDDMQSYPAADEADDDEDDDVDDEDDESHAANDGDDESDDDRSDDESDSDESDGDDGDVGDDADGDDGSDDDGESDQSTDNDKPGGGTSAPDEDDRTLDEALHDAMRDALNDEETSADLDRVEDQVQNGVAGGGDLDRTIGQWDDVTDAARLLARDVSEVLAVIKDDNEAAWVRRTDTGRFNVGRWATDPDWDADNVFDEFQPGAMDASALDVVLVLDISGSMSSQVRRLAEATWAIRTAVDRVEGTCTVLGFGNGASLMFDAGQRPDGRVFIPNLEGSTHPTPACREALSLVASSSAANRIVVLLTDGQWWDGKAAAEALIACQQEGATTVIVGLGPGASDVVPGFCNADVVARIAEPGELVAIFREVTERSMLAAARR